jgi:hypothetical protein
MNGLVEIKLIGSRKVKLFGFRSWRGGRLGLGMYKSPEAKEKDYQTHRNLLSLNVGNLAMLAHLPVVSSLLDDIDGMGKDKNP